MNTWCVAKPSASKEELTNNIYFACQTLKETNCTQVIGNGGCCFEPDTLINHASVVMNSYYVENGRNAWNCDFKGTGLVTVTDPSNVFLHEIFVFWYYNFFLTRFRIM